MLKDYNEIKENQHSVLHFLPGNSFTPCSYANILNEFTQNYLVKVFLLRSLWGDDKKPKFNDWKIFLDDYINSIDIDNNIIGIGHSIGGNLLLKAAILKPEKFKKIILLDPTFFRPRIIRVWKFFNFFNIQHYFLPLIKSAQNKKMSFDCIDEMFISYRKNKKFSNFNDETLLQLIESLIMEVENNRVELIYPSDWDSRIYKKGLLNDMFIWKNLKSLKVDTSIIMASNSDVFTNSTKELVIRYNSSIKIHPILDADHLFPLNRSGDTIELLRSII
tara:strand:- start:463 stop:1290 length:828 start_codon:yes stop_codon:yes gene_type:complete